MNEEKTINIPAKILVKIMPLLRSILGSQIANKALVVHKQTLQTSDGERLLSMVMPGNLDFANLSFIVAGDVFADVIRLGGQADNWQIEDQENQISMQKGKQKLQLIKFKQDAEKELCEMQPSNQSIQIDPMLFKNLLKGVMFCASTSDTKPLLKGINITTANEEIVFMATDGYRIGRIKGNIEKQENQKTLNATFSPKTLSTLNSLLDITDIAKGSFNISWEQNNVIFTGTSQENIKWSLESKALVGIFPNCQRFFEKTDGKFVCDVKTLYDYVNQAGIIVRDSQIVSLIFNKNILQVKAAHVTLGKYENELEGSMEGECEENVQLNFKVSLLAKILQALPAGRVNIFLKATGPILFTSNHTNIAEYVLLPLKYTS